MLCRRVAMKQRLTPGAQFESSSRSAAVLVDLGDVAGCVTDLHVDDVGDGHPPALAFAGGLQPVELDVTIPCARQRVKQLKTVHPLRTKQGE